MEFPLYDELSSAHNYSVELATRAPLVGLLSPNPNHELIMMLILHHAIRTGIVMTNELPYGIILNNFGFLVTIENLPIELQRILSEFLLRVNR